MISVLKPINVAQFLNTTCVAAASSCFYFFGTGGLARALAAIVLKTAIFLVNKVYASE